APPARVQPQRLAASLLPLPQAPRIALVNGALAPQLQAGDSDGVRVEDLAALLAGESDTALRALREPADDADDRFALLAEACAGGGARIEVAARAAPAQPLYLLHVDTAAAPAASHTRLVIELAPHSTLTLVEHFVTLGAAPALANLAAEFRLGEGATLRHLRLHAQAASVAQVETWTGTLAAGARYEQQLLLLGGQLVRSGLRLALAGAGAEAHLAGLFMLDGARQADVYTRIEHAAPRTRVAQNFRGIASDRGQGAFSGRIIVQPAARGADAAQSSRNLLLSPQAAINARPQLEILCDDVQCRHGATTGTLDPNQYFYLLSRGLAPAAARALLTHAFCADVIAALAVPALRGNIEELVVGRLPDHDLIRGLR
ncbi:MAG: Fe-S cluster assembly protein SufD, partial [Gammaproteobacteria bacterium]|nr:Fe-S cluster assembly protein SufD [Gammaproteobacteria bacterium]